MYCNKCGTLAVADAKFCSKCGNLVSAGISEKPSEAPSVTADVAKPRKLWLYIAGVLLVGAYAAMFLPAFAGQSMKPELGLGSMFWTGVFFYYLWKRRAHKGWHGALIGSALGILVFIVAAFVGGFMRSAAGG